ncbi:MAG TPA: hydrogenase maturation protease [Bacteroidota bacterium]
MSALPHINAGSENTRGILVLGLGNLLLTDEGVGVHAAQRLQQMQLPANVEVVDGGTGGFELIEHCRGKSKIIIIDCLSADAAPGSVIRLSLDEIDPQRPPPFSAHQGGIRELLAFIPSLTPIPEVTIYGVVPVVVDQLSMELSPTVEAQLPKIVSTVIDESRSKTAEPSA